MRRLLVDSHFVHGDRHGACRAVFHVGLHRKIVTREATTGRGT